MARQIVDTTTDHGTYRGDPAPTAFEKLNSNDGEQYALTAGLTYQGSGPGGTYTASGWVATGSGATIGWDDRAEGSPARWVSFVSNGVLNFYYIPSGGFPMTVSRTGQVTAVSFNPASSAEVKDNLEGYTADATGLLDRLVVIEYVYRPEYVDLAGHYVGLLAENVGDVIPMAMKEATEIAVPVVGPDGKQLVGEDGVGLVEMEHTPAGVDLMQILAVCVRAHQQKSRRLDGLEQREALLLARVAELESRLPPAAVEGDPA